ncbi:MAG: tetratricopeptide repeat protein [Bacteroidales bacterium]|jgi:tetratricopeptide (TPR) repeat protein|nr:tetratricopeptide repeat protein [Bacteroidales bacterium]
MIHRLVPILFLLFLFQAGTLSSMNSDSLKARLKFAGTREQIYLLNDLSRSLRSDSPAASLRYAYQACALAKARKDFSGEAQAYQNIGMAYAALSQFIEAENNLQIAFQKMKMFSDSVSMISLYQCFGNLYLQKADYRKALPYFKRVSTLSETLRLPDDPVVAECIGSCYKGIGDNQRAVEFFQKTLEIYKNKGIENERYNPVFSLGMIYAEWGWDEQALENYNKALKIQIAHNDSIGSAFTLVNMAGIYGKSLGNEKAMEYFDIALNIFKKLKNPRGIGYTLNGIGQYFKSVEKYDSALASFNEAISNYQQIQYWEGMAFVYGNMGEIFMKEKNYRIALSCFTRSLQLADSSKSEIARGTALTALGKICQQTGQLNKALTLFHQSLEIAVSRNFKEAMSDNYLELSKLYKQLGQFNMAFDYIQLYNETRDSLFKENSQKVIAEMEARYTTEKKERQIDLLTKENELNKLAIRSKERFTRLSVISSVVLLLLLMLLTRFYFLKHRAYTKYVRLTLDQLKKEQQTVKNTDTKPGVRQSAIQASPESETMNQRLIEALKLMMVNERLFLDPGITLADMAQKLNTNTTYLSRAINEMLNKNFSVYINELRIHEAQIMLAGKEYANWSIEGIAVSVGFNSKSAFNSAFKKFTGVTPSFFQKSALNQEI